jgi:hypothetical protein
MLVCSACATTEGAEKKTEVASGDERQTAATSQVRSALEALPRCEAGAGAGLLTVKATTCTKMYCGKACCNQCSWEATLELKNGQKRPVEAARVKAALKVSDGALECEVAAWGEVLVKESLAFDATTCIVR